MKTLVTCLMASLIVATGASAVKPELDPSWVDGKLYYMIGTHTVPNAAQLFPNEYAKAEEIYLLAYLINNETSDATNPRQIPSGYQPNCNPCYHPGLPPQLAYHDHVLTGAPGLGKDGTAGTFKAPWKIIVLVYNPERAMSPTFVPIKSASDIDAAEANGMFLPINDDGKAGPNRFEIDTGTLLICPLVSPHA